MKEKKFIGEIQVLYEFAVSGSTLIEEGFEPTPDGAKAYLRSYAGVIRPFEVDGRDLRGRTWLPHTIDAREERF